MNERLSYYILTILLITVLFFILFIRFKPANKKVISEQKANEILEEWQADKRNLIVKWIRK